MSCLLDPAVPGGGCYFWHALSWASTGISADPACTTVFAQPHQREPPAATFLSMCQVSHMTLLSLLNTHPHCRGARAGKKSDAAYLDRAPRHRPRFSCVSAALTVERTIASCCCGPQLVRRRNHFVVPAGLDGSLETWCLCMARFFQDRRPTASSTTGENYGLVVQGLPASAKAFPALRGLLTALSSQPAPHRAFRQSPFVGANLCVAPSRLSSSIDAVRIFDV
jgi:hypothetical protein